MIALAVTGHRPKTLGGYSSTVSDALLRTAGRAIDKINPDVIIVGMALGWDQAIAHAAVLGNIPFIAAVPFLGQQHMWPEHAQATYACLLAKAKDVVVVCPGGYSPEKMQLRNRWMVERCTVLLALWNGEAGGGTYNCIQYARKNNKKIYNCWNAFTRARGY